MEFTGERVIPGKTDLDLMNEHWARYQFAEPLVHGKLVVDAGCGVGYGSAFLAASARLVLALDSSTEALGAAREDYSHPKVALINADCGRLPLPDASVDIVAAFEVIEHLDDWQVLLSEAARVMAPHGQLLVSTPNRLYSQESRHEPNPFHVHEFEYSEFESELGKRFPYVLLFLENHSDSITFIPPQGEGVRTRLGGRELDTESAHFFLAVCSKQPQQGSPAFVFVPTGGNVLREREQHVKALQEQVRELKQHVKALQEQVRERDVKALQEQVREREQHVKALQEQVREREQHVKALQEQVREREQHVKALQEQVREREQHVKALQEQVRELKQHVKALQEQVRELEQENAERARWAEELNAELESVRSDRRKLIERLDETELRVIERSEWAMSLDRELKETQQHLASLRRSLVFRISRRLGLIHDPKAEHEPTP